MATSKCSNLFVKQVFFLFVLLNCITGYSQCVPDWSNFGVNSSSAATLEYDNFVSSFHSTIVRDVDGNFLIWGERSKPNGSDEFKSPTKINKSNFSDLTGTPLRAAEGSYVSSGGTVYIQHFILTSNDKLWVWGKEGAVVSSSVKSGNAFSSFSLPSGVTAKNVKMLFATSKTLVITTCSGNVWVLSQNGHMRGNGNSGDNSTWYQVKKSSGANDFLTGIVATRGSATGLIALDASGNLWTWGTSTYDGNNNTSSPGARSYATAMKKPTGIGTIKMIGATSNGDNTSYYVLDTGGKLFAMGNNGNGQLGDFSTTERKEWIQPKYSNGGSNQEMNNISWIAPQEHDDYTPFINVINSAGVLYNWGKESRSALGRGESGDRDPGAPSNFPSGKSNTDIMAVESGGHTTMILKKCEDKFGYIGHRVNGSMACGSCGNDDDIKTFSFATAPIQIAGVITAPTIRNDVSTAFCNGSTIALVGQPAGGTFTISSGGGTLNGNKYTFPASGTGDIKITYTVSGFCSPVEITFTRSSCKAISGTLWVDNDMNSVKDPSENGSNNGGTLWVNLVDPVSGKVVSSVEVDSYGNYYIQAPSSPTAGNYKIIVTNQQKTVGTSLSTSDVPDAPNSKFTGTNINGTANTGNNTGVASIDLSIGGNATVDFGLFEKTLSASFGNVSAKLISDKLIINWTALTETNNDRFDIEASADGENFTKIGSVKSLAENGNATQAIQYNFEKDASSAAMVLGFSLLTIGSIGLFAGRKRRVLLTLLVLLGIATLYAGCSKEDKSVSKDGKLYIRIAQVDKDGGKSYSKTVVVISE